MVMAEGGIFQNTRQPVESKDLSDELYRRDM